MKRPVGIVGFQNHGGGCDEDAMKCSVCMTPLTEIENTVTGTLSGLLGFKDTKSGAIKSALIVKDFIFGN